jgi:hypothetical protein
MSKTIRKNEDRRDSKDWLAIAVFEKTGAGKHGGDKKLNNKRARKSGKRDFNEGF